MHSARVIIILFNTDLYRSAFSTYSLKKLFSRISVFIVFCLYYLQLNVIFEEFSEKFCVIYIFYRYQWFSILFSPSSLLIKLLVLT